MKTDSKTEAQPQVGRRYHVDGTVPDSGAIWVFGSNLAGRHGLGAALVAKDQFGARSGVGVGLTGRSYAIPTKDGRSGGSLRLPKEVLGLDVVRSHVDDFVEFARNHPELTFVVTRVGCGHAAHPDKDIAPMFSAAPSNCSFANEWREHFEPQGRPTPARPRPR